MRKLLALFGICLLCIGCGYDKSDVSTKPVLAEDVQDTETQDSVEDAQLGSKTRENVENFYGFSIAGDNYAWPLTIKDLEDAGFAISSHTPSDVVIPIDYYWTGSLSNELLDIYVTVHNTAEEDLPATDCQLISIDIINYDNDISVEVVSTYGYALGESIDDVVTDMGNVSVQRFVERNGIRTVVTVQKDDSKYVTYRADDGIINEITIHFE